MKLASQNDGSRDGHLVVVNRKGTHLKSAAQVAPTLQHALDKWDTCEPKLRRLAQELELDLTGAEEVQLRSGLATLALRAVGEVETSADRIVSRAESRSFRAPTPQAIARHMLHWWLEQER